MKYILILVFLILPVAVHAGDLEDRVNAERVKVGLQELRVDKELVQTAKFKVNDMIFWDYFAHKNPLGDRFTDIFKRFNVEWVGAGEILGMGFTDNGELIQAYMDSPTHKDIIIQSYYKGVGCYSRKEYTACHFKL